MTPAVVSFEFLSESLDGVGDTKKIHNFGLSYGAYKKPQHQQSPCRGAHDRAGCATELRTEKVTGVSIDTY